MRKFDGLMLENFSPRLVIIQGIPGGGEGAGLCIGELAFWPFGL